MGRNGLVFLWAVIGAVVGQLIGSALKTQVPLLDYALALGFDPTNINLGFVVMTVGISLRLSIAGAIGLVLALWFALRNV